MPIKRLSQTSLASFQKHSNMLAGNPAYSPPVFDLLETTVLSSDTASVTFSSLGSYSDYKHLQIRATVRGSANFNNDRPIVRLNGLQGQNYAEHRMVGNGSSVSSTGAASQDKIQHSLIPGNTGTSNSFGAVVIDVLDFSNTNKNKTVRTLMGGHWNSFEVGLISGVVLTTNSITSITLGTNNGGYATGCRFSLYGVK